MICHWIICTVLGAAFTACNDNGVIDKTKFSDLQYQLTQPGKVLITECVEPGQKPALTYTDKTGALMMRKR